MLQLIKDTYNWLMFTGTKCNHRYRIKEVLNLKDPNPKCVYCGEGLYDKH